MHHHPHHHQVVEEEEEVRCIKTLPLILGVPYSISDIIDVELVCVFAGMPGLGGMNIGSIISNPRFMNMVLYTLYSN